MTNINSKFLVVNSEDENAPKTKSQHQADLSNRKTNPKSDKPRWIKTSIVIGVVVLIISSAIIAKKFSTTSPTLPAVEALSISNAASEKTSNGSTLAGPLESFSPPAPATINPNAIATSTEITPPIASTPAPTSAIANPSISTIDQTALHTSIDQLVSDFKSLSGREDQVENDLATIKTNLAEQQTKTAVEAKHLTHHRSPAKSKLTVTEKSTERTIGVLSIDTWDGRPSVSVSQGQEIRFIGEGDALTDGYVLKQADSKKQQAIFVSPSGETRGARSSVNESQ